MNHGDLDLVYFWAAILIVLTPLLVLGTIGVLVVRKFWRERHDTDGHGAQNSP
jgi:hypothetical protein